MDNWFDLNLETCKGLETSGVIQSVANEEKKEKRIFIKASQLKYLKAKL